MWLRCLASAIWLPGVLGPLCHTPKCLRRRNVSKARRQTCLKFLGHCMAKKSKRALVSAAAKARRRAVAPYSGFRVGAALLTRKGEIVTGANVESASYGLTCCAERVALFNALTSGRKDFVAVAVVAKVRGGPMPCGACRQLLAEYATK